MICGTVTFTLGGDDGYVAILRDEGWSVPGLATMAETLNGEFGLDRYGPADGDPFIHAIHDAAEFLNGQPTVMYVPPPIDDPDRVY